MLFNPKRETAFDRLAEELRLASEPNSKLLTKLMRSCQRLSSTGNARAAAHVDRLIAADAWTDAALAIVALELPAWKVRRLVWDDGEWICSLSRQPWLPVELDEVQEASHEVLPLAILSAFVQVQRTAASSSEKLTAVPSVRPTAGYAICCDNFS